MSADKGFKTVRPTQVGTRCRGSKKLSESVVRASGAPPDAVHRLKAISGGPSGGSVARWRPWGEPPEDPIARWSLWRECPGGPIAQWSRWGERPTLPIAQWRVRRERQRSPIASRRLPAAPPDSPSRDGSSRRSPKLPNDAHSCFGNSPKRPHFRIRSRSSAPEGRLG